MQQPKQNRRHHLLLKTSAGFIAIMVLSGIALAITSSNRTAIAGDNNNLIPLQQCQRLDLIDKDTRKPIVGAEDLAIDHSRNILFISAYDRRAVKKAAKKKKNIAIPTGGIYRLSLNNLFTDLKNPIELQSLIRDNDIIGGLRPHGMTYDQDTNEIIFINRGYDRFEKKWRMTPRVERIGADGAVIISKSNDTVCAANDITVHKSKILVSFDHASCNWRGGLEDIFSLRRSGLMQSDQTTPLYNEAGYANGLAQTPSGDLALAATREKAIHIFSKTIEGVDLQEKIALPGGPDNLTVSYDGALIAAVHPSLFRMGAHRKLNWGRAPSRIVRVDPDTRSVTTLLNEPSGKIFSAATVGIETRTALILGSVTDTGLLLCRKQSTGIVE